MKGNDNLFAAVGDDILLLPLVRTSARYYLFVLFLLALIGWGGYALFIQTRDGLGVTGLTRPTFWGVYITNFVFFIGISHAGTLISAILRVAKAEWRRPITRSAEAITVFALCIGAPQVLIDLGRLDRIPNVMINSRFQSPLLWDVSCIATYLAGSITYLWLPMIPDLAICRDRLPASMRWRRFFYSSLALGWRGTPKQKHTLEVAIGVMAVIIIPVAVSVHTVVAFIFSMTIQPMWHSTVLGPYFVIGAIFTGIASILIAMAILRKVYRLQNYFRPLHFDYLGQLLIVMTLLWAYMTLAEYLTTFYGGEPAHLSVFYAKFTGYYAPIFWTMIVCCFIIPLPILVFHRTIGGTVVASLFINVGMWLERYTIVLPTLTNPRLPYQMQFYSPTWVEVAITVASFALLFFLFAVFVKLFPIVSIWEVQEGRELAGEPQSELVAPIATEELVGVQAKSGRIERPDEAGLYFPIHLLLIGTGVAVFLTTIGWLIWRIVVGGPFAAALGLVVIAVLTCIMISGWGSALVIALDGRTKLLKVRSVRSRTKPISANRWTIHSARDRSGSF